LLSKHFFVAVGWVVLKRMLTVFCDFTAVPSTSSEWPGSNYPAAEDTCGHRKASVFETANKQGYNK
jgi:hypothetical protein